MSESTEKPLTAYEVQQKLGISPRTLQRWRDTGKIRYLRYSERCYRYKPSEVRRILSEASSHEAG